MSFARNYHSWILDKFRPHLGRDVAEVGAGSGNFSELLLGESTVRRLVSFEPSANMFPHLESTLARDSRATAINDFFGPRTRLFEEAFDSILYVNVLEHVEDDLAELSMARTCLKPGGKLLVFVPACSWLMSDFDRRIGHFRRYTKSGLQEVVRKASFRVESAKYFDLPGVLPWFLVFVLLHKNLSGGNVTLYDRLVVPWLRHLESICAPPIGKNLLLVASKD